MNSLLIPLFWATNQLKTGYIHLRSVGQFINLILFSLLLSFNVVKLLPLTQRCAPNSLTSNFNALHSCYFRLTRGSSQQQHNYHLSKNMANCPTSFAFTAIKIWSWLPVSLEELGSEHAFKSRLKEYLFSTY